jgi:hypothetical protein
MSRPICPGRLRRKESQQLLASERRSLEATHLSALPVDIEQYSLCIPVLFAHFVRNAGLTGESVMNDA